MPLCLGSSINSAGPGVASGIVGQSVGHIEYWPTPVSTRTVRSPGRITNEPRFIMNPLEPNASGKRSRYGSQTLTEVSENSAFMGKRTTPSETEVMFMFPISRRCPVSDVVINAPLSASIMLIFRPVAGRPRLFVSRIAPRHLSLPEPTLHLQNPLGLFHYRWLFRR